MSMVKRSKTFYILCIGLTLFACYFTFSFLYKGVYNTNENRWIQPSKFQSDSVWGLPNLKLPSWGDNSNKTAASKQVISRVVVESDRRSLLIPKDEVIDKMNEQQMRNLYWQYVNSVQFLCKNQTRLGSFRDGGKEVCIDNEFKPGKPCLVYSFGSNFQFDFEQAVINAFACDVHTFDPTVNLKQKGKKVPSNVNFYLKGLDGKDYLTPKKWQMATLQSIMKELNHTGRIIDLLKIDIEGSEWNALSQMFKVGTLSQAKQILIEIHFAEANTKSNWGGVSTREQLKILRGLYEEGFRIFMREHNLYSLRSFKTDYNTQYTNVNELSLINLKYLT